jgi:hypothetical protein
MISGRVLFTKFFFQLCNYIKKLMMFFCMISNNESSIIYMKFRDIFISYS